MAINKSKKQDETAKVTYNFEVKRAKDLDKVIMFDWEVNGIMIYGMAYRTGKTKEGKDYTLVSFPSRKGNDDKYYNHCWFKITDEMLGEIEKQIEALI